MFGGAKSRNLAPAEKAGADELNQRLQSPALRNTLNSFRVVLICCETKAPGKPAS
jgi:hypothetical protein